MSLVPLNPVKFEALLPKLLSTGSVTFFGKTRTRGTEMEGREVAHEHCHYLLSLDEGNLKWTVKYCWTFVKLLFKTRFRKTVAVYGNVAESVMEAYWIHPSEALAREWATGTLNLYSGINKQTYTGTASDQPQLPTISTMWSVFNGTI